MEDKRFVKFALAAMLIIVTTASVIWVVDTAVSRFQAPPPPAHYYWHVSYQFHAAIPGTNEMTHKGFGDSTFRSSEAHFKIADLRSALKAKLQEDIPRRTVSVVILVWMPITKEVYEASLAPEQGDSKGKELSI